MEDFRVDVDRRQGPGRDRDPAGAAAVHPGRRHHPGRACCRRRCATGSASPAHLDFYAAAELEQRPAPLGPAARRRRSTEAGAAEIAGRSRGTPRIANRLLRRVRDWAQVHGRRAARPDGGPRGAGAVTRSTTLGLDRLDRAVLEALCRRFGGGPVGLSTLAVAVGEEPETVETVAEPFLVREGCIVRTPRGRVAAAARPGRTSGSRPPGRSRSEQDAAPARRRARTWQRAPALVAVSRAADSAHDARIGPFGRG